VVVDPQQVRDIELGVAHAHLQAHSAAGVNDRHQVHLHPVMAHLDRRGIAVPHRNRKLAPFSEEGRSAAARHELGVRQDAGQLVPAQCVQRFQQSSVGCHEARDAVVRIPLHERP
jgi:hypothetical protein